MSEELIGYKISPEGGGYRLELQVKPGPPELLPKVYEIFLHHVDVLDLANTLRDTVRGLGGH